MLYSPYDDDSDDARAGDPAAGFSDVTVGGYDLSADPAMMDYILNGSGTWPDGRASDNPIYLPASSGPVSKVMPVVPSDEAAGAAPGPAIVPTLADTGGGSGPATYVPIVASLGAGLGSLSDSVGGKVVPVVAGEGGHAVAPPPFDAGLAGSDDYVAQQAAAGSDSDSSQPTGPADLLGGRHYVQTPTGDWSLQSDAPSSADGASLTDVVDRQNVQPASNGQAAPGRPGPSERDPLAAQLARQGSTNVLGFHVDPSTGVVTRVTTGPDGQRVLTPATATEKQIVLEQMLGAQSFATGQMSPQEANARAALRIPGSHGTSPLTDQGITWLQGREQNSVDLTPATAGNSRFDDASKTYTDPGGHVTFGYGHVLTAADARCCPS